MLKFILKISLFFVLVLVLFLATLVIPRAFHSKVFKPGKDYFCRDFQRAFCENYPADIILAGNSRILSGLSAGEMEKLTGRKVLQLGYSSSNLSTTKLILTAYLKSAKKLPGTVILEVSWFSFNPNRTGFHKQISGDMVIAEPGLVKYFFTYPGLYNAYMLQLFRSFYGKKNQPYTDYSISKRSDYPGIDSTRKNYRLDLKKFESVFPHHEAGTDPRLLSDFRDILRLCKDYHVRVIMYTGPEDSLFTSLQKDRNSIMPVFRKCAGNPGVYYLDYSCGGKFYSKGFEKILINSDHVFFEDIFTRNFVRDLKAEHLF